MDFYEEKSTFSEFVISLKRKGPVVVRGPKAA